MSQYIEYVENNSIFKENYETIKKICDKDEQFNQAYDSEIKKCKIKLLKLKRDIRLKDIYFTISKVVLVLWCFIYILIISGLEKFFHMGSDTVFIWNYILIGVLLTVELGILAIMVPCLTAKSKVKDVYKTFLVDGILKVISDEVSYSKHGNYDKIMDSLDKAFTEIDSIKCEDYINFKLEDGRYIETSDIVTKVPKLKMMMTKGSSANNGIFGVVELKNISKKYRLSVKNKSLVDTGSYKKRKIDFEEFNKIFSLDFSNEKITHELLTEDLMKEFIDFYSKYNIPMQVKILKGKLYFLFSSLPMFETYEEVDEEKERYLLFYYYYIYVKMNNLVLKFDESINNI